MLNLSTRIFSFPSRKALMTKCRLVQRYPNRYSSSTPAAFPKGEENDPEKERKLKVLMLEMDVARQEGRRAPDPSKMKEEHWNHLLELKTISSRQKFYAFLWQIEMKKESQKRKREEEKAEIAMKREEKQNAIAKEEHVVYGLNYTSMFLRIYDSTMNLWFNNRLTRAMQFAPKIVIDCSYEKYMSRAEASNCAKQLMFAFADNRMAENPFDLHFCNFNPQEYAAKQLQKHIPRMLDEDFPMNVHEKSYLEVFDHRSLVYLTPHCRQEMTSYNPDDVYIVGAMVDKRNTEPLSLAKAKRQNLRMAKLPLDRYLQWTSGSGKSLTINQMISILLTLKDTSDWEKALEVVPRRKILRQPPESQQYEWIEKRLKQLKYTPKA
uniref:RNA (guanine-9-)-methyltransferase domain-containing protein 1 n=1 Tax=Lutzomyia longipalpis TaxID=7200 RepID=A0A7G3AR47_LUTLO